MMHTHAYIHYICIYALILCYTYISTYDNNNTRIHLTNIHLYTYIDTYSTHQPICRSCGVIQTIIHTYIHTHTYILHTYYKQTSTHTYMHTHTNIHTLHITYIHILHSYMYIHIFIHTHIAYIHTCTFIHVHTYINTYIYTYIHTYIHYICTQCTHTYKYLHTLHITYIYSFIHTCKTYIRELLFVVRHMGRCSRIHVPHLVRLRGVHHHRIGLVFHYKGWARYIFP